MASPSPLKLPEPRSSGAGLIQSHLMTPAEAERIVFDTYGLSADIEPLTGETDENFRVVSEQGEFVLKVASPAEEVAVVDLATSALRHIEQVDPSFPCPRVCRDLQGRVLSRVRDAAGFERLVRLLTWMPGLTLQMAPRSAALRAACGSVAARLAHALHTFRHPAAARPMLWDLCQLARLRPLLDEVPGFAEGPYIAEFLSAYEAVTEPAFGRVRRQVLHNDMNLRNILVDPDDPVRIVGLIDFGDVVETALVADLAVVASAQLQQGSTSPEADLMDTVNAYRAACPLLDEEMAILNWLIAGRLVSGLLIPAWHRARNTASGHYPIKTEASVADRIELIETLRRMRLK